MRRRLGALTPLLGLRGRLYCERRSMGFDDSGGAGLKARMRVFVLMPHAEASVDWYAVAPEATLVCAGPSSSSSRLRPSSERVTSSSDPRPPRSNALAAVARTVEPSDLELDLGRCSRSSLVVPALMMASLAVRLGMKRSAALYAIRVLVGRARIEASFLDLAGVFVVVEPVPVSDHSETPRSSRRGDLCEPRAMLDLGELCVVLEMERWKRDIRLPP
jgi:hypothetical protein